jgi:hypothetical protein
MNRVSTTDAESSAQAARHWMWWWIVGGVGVVVCSLTLLLWGIAGPTYIFDLIAAYCG